MLRGPYQPAADALVRAGNPLALTPQVEENRLRGILGQRRIAKLPPSHTEYPTDMRPHKSAELVTGGGCDS
jgi:hypothetical protein